MCTHRYEYQYLSLLPVLCYKSLLHLLDNIIHNVHITVASAVARFTNAACATGGVNPTDPLLFICEVNGGVLLRLLLPTGDQEIVSVEDTAADLPLPTGFTAVSLDITEINDFQRNFNLTISIATASLLGGGEITCDNTTSRNQASASCPIIGKLNSLYITMAVSMSAHYISLWLRCSLWYI